MLHFIGCVLPLELGFLGLQGGLFNVSFNSNFLTIAHFILASYTSSLL